MHVCVCTWNVGVCIAGAHTCGSQSRTFGVYSVLSCLIALRQGLKLTVSARLTDQSFGDFPISILNWALTATRHGFSWILGTQMLVLMPTNRA